MQLSKKTCFNDLQVFDKNLQVFVLMNLFLKMKRKWILKKSSRTNNYGKNYTNQSLGNLKNAKSIRTLRATFLFTVLIDMQTIKETIKVFYFCNALLLFLVNMHGLLT